MNIDDISTQMMYTTTPVYAFTQENKLSCGTGFIFSIQQSEETSIPLLITNYHVVENAVSGYIELHTSENDLPSKKVVRLKFDNSILKDSKLGNLDLIALPLASALNDMQSRGTNIFYKSIDFNLIPKDDVIDKFAAVEDITFIGYPYSIYDLVNKIPVIRHGITATPIWNNFQGKDEFLIDAGVFPGSNGSPVFIYNRGTYPTAEGIAVGSRILFIGVLSKTFQRNDNNGLEYLNLGVVINSKAFIKELNNYLVKMTGETIPNL